MNADYWYGLKHRSDLLLFYTIANQLIEKDYLDHKFIEEHTEKFEDFKEFVKAYTLERGVEGTGLSKEQILEFVELIHSGKKVSFWWTMGVNQGYEAVRTAQAIINIAHPDHREELERAAYERYGAHYTYIKNAK